MAVPPAPRSGHSRRYSPARRNASAFSSAARKKPSSSSFSRSGPTAGITPAALAFNRHPRVPKNRNPMFWATHRACRSSRMIVRARSLANAIASASPSSTRSFSDSTSLRSVGGLTLSHGRATPNSWSTAGGMRTSPKSAARISRASILSRAIKQALSATIAPLTVRSPVPTPPQDN